MHDACSWAGPCFVASNQRGQDYNQAWSTIEHTIEITEESSENSTTSPPCSEIRKTKKREELGWLA